MPGMEKPQRKKLREAIYKKLVGDAPASLDPAILSDARQQVQALLLLPRIEMHDLTAAVQRIGADLPLKNFPHPSDYHPRDVWGMVDCCSAEAPIWGQLDSDSGPCHCTATRCPGPATEWLPHLLGAA